MTIFAGKKKRGESKADKTRSCVRPYMEIWVHESAKSQKQIIQRAIGYKKKKKISTRHLLVVTFYLEPIVYQET